ADGFASDLIAEKREVRMPVTPLVLAHQVLGAPQFAGKISQCEERELSRGFGEHIGGVGEGNSAAVGVSAINTVKPDRVLRYGFERAFARLENFGVNLVAQGGDEAVNAAVDLLDDEALRRRLRIGIDLDLITPLAQAIKGGLTYIGRGEDTELFLWHASHQDACAIFPAACAPTRILARHP